MAKNGSQTVSMRGLALEAMLSIVEKGENATTVMAEMLEKYQYLPKEERAFFGRLVRGTLEHLLEMDYLINQVSKTKVKKMKPVIRNILRLGTYQLKYMDSVPDHAACSESVNLAVGKGFFGLRGFVNGVMRALARGLEEDALPLPDAEETPMEWLSVRYSMPIWLCELFTKQYGLDDTKRIFKSYEEEHDTTLHLVHNRANAKEYKELLRRAKKTSPYLSGIQIKEAAYLAEQAIRVKGYELLEDLPGYMEGKFWVQDESSMLAVAAAYIKQGQTVVDVCASPGGKSLLASEYVGKDGLVYSFDVSEQKVERIKENKERLNFSMLIPEVRDATAQIPETVHGTADVVIADVPCSGLGVIGKKPDIRYNLKPEGIVSLISLQRKILSNAMDYVKPGGTLLYCTCTTNWEENEANVEWMLKQGGFTMLPDPLMYIIKLGFKPEPWQNEQMEKGYLTLLPGINDCDGFFMATLKRKG